MVHMHLNERQAIIGSNILKIHTFSNLSDLYEILNKKTVVELRHGSPVRIVRISDMDLRLITVWFNSWEKN